MIENTNTPAIMAAIPRKRSRCALCEIVESDGPGTFMARGFNAPEGA
jgi:hypothetical protein